MATQAVETKRVRVEKNFRNGYVVVMSNKNAPHTPTFVSAETYEAIAEQLKEWSDRLTKLTGKVRNKNEPGLYQFNWNTLEFAMNRIASAVASAEESQIRSAMGSPIIEGERKPRSRNKADTTIDKDRLSHKKSSPRKKKT